MKQVNQADAKRCEWLEQNLRRSVDFHALLLAMAGHDLRQNLQIIAHTYGRLASCATSGPERERIARGQRAVMQLAEQLHQLVTASQIHQKTSEIALAPVRLSSLFSTIDTDTNRFASEQGGAVACGSDASGGRKRSSPVGERDWQSYAECRTGAGGRSRSDAGVCRLFRIEVYDTGTGIPSQPLRDIFAAFHRLEPLRSDGLGLGLYVEKRAAKLLQHQIDVRSTVGRGSCFMVLANASSYD